MAAIACPADASGTVPEPFGFAHTCATVSRSCHANDEPLLSGTGLILRRCTLDAVGLASWENPTHIKCVSKNYETIQTLVSS